MENKNTILIIVFVLIIILAGALFFSNFNTTENQPIDTGQNNEQQEKKDVVDPVVQQALDIRKTTEMVNGTLYEVGDTYFVIEKSVPKGGQDALANPEDVEFIKEYTRVNINPSTKIFDLSDIKHIVIPSNITGPINILNYLLSKTDEYIIYIYIAANTAIVNGEIQTEYIEWSSWPKDQSL